MADSPSFDRSIIEGPIPSAVWRIAWPTLLQNLVAGLQGLVDHVMVGHYVGFQGNAAIGVSWQIFLVVVVFISSLFSGMGVLVARFAGAGDSGKVNRVVFQVILVSTFLGLFVFAPLGYFAAPALLDVVHAEPGVQAEALPYLRIMFVFSLGMMHFFMLGGALRAAGDARTPMRLGILLTVLNLVLNVVLIRGLGPIPAFGTAGAAMGTVIATALVSLVAFYLLFSGRLVIRLSGSDGWRPDWAIISRVFRFGLPTGFQGIVMNIGGVLMIRYVGTLQQSAEAQAAFAVGYSQLFSLIVWTSNSLMAASATVAGQNLGAEQPERSAAAPRSATAVGLFLAVPMALTFLLVPKAVFGIFGIEDATVLALGEELLAYLSLSAIFVTAALSYTGALQGTGDTRSPFYISLFSQLVLPLSICAVLDVTRGLQPADIWIAIVLGHFSRCVLSVLRFQQGKWKDIRVEIGEAVG
jgi:putative MATE family efflux protein